MNASDDLDRHLSAFLQEGPIALPDVSFDAVRDDIEHTRQRVSIGPWRFPDMNKFLALGLGAVAVVVALVVGVRLLGPTGSSAVGGPAPSATPTPTALVTAAPSTVPSSPAVGELPRGPYKVVDVEARSGTPQITVSIPGAGWHGVPDFGGVGTGADDDPPEGVVLVWSWPAGTRFDVYRDPCKWTTSRPAKPATTVDEIAAALAAQPSRDASKPVDVTVGGYAGKHITLHVPGDAADPAKASLACDQGKYASYGVTGEAEPTRWHQGSGQIDDLWILDVDDRIVIIDAMSRQKGKFSATPAARIDEMRSIAESATFE